MIRSAGNLNTECVEDIVEYYQCGTLDGCGDCLEGVLIQNVEQVDESTPATNDSALRRGCTVQ
jgi:hypothetical protein